MKIQNLSLKGGKLALRYTRDENGVPVTCVGDKDGVFEMGERDALMLLDTPGWRRPGKTPAVTAPVAPKAPTLADTVAKGTAEAPPPSKTPANVPDEDELEAPDINGLRTKAAAQAMAALWRERGYEIPLLDEDTQKLSDMKAVLTEALIADEDTPEG